MNYAGIEAGGTKFVLALADEDLQIIKRKEVPTTTPEETLKLVEDFFKGEEFIALGLGSFGPIDPNKKSATYGHITSTPKEGWNNYNIVKRLREMFKVPVAFNTDVNVAAFAEEKIGAAQNVNSCLYMTVGTGIGAGAVFEGSMLNGLLHPEMGHTSVIRHPDDNFEGTCPFHHDCLEGLASGPAIEKRWGKKGEELTEMDEVWELESYYLAQALSNFMLILSPEKIIIGGGVSKQKQLFPKIQKKFLENLNGYIVNKEIYSNDFITSPELEPNSGIIGALLIAKDLVEEKN